MARPQSLMQKLLRQKPPKQSPLPVPVVPDPDRSGIAIAVIVKDEALDLEEWIAFHTLMGVGHFYIYDNGSTDGTADLARSLSAHYPVTVIPWINFIDQPSPQRLAFIHALTNFGHAWRWMLFNDVDEFVFPVQDESLTEALARLEHLPSICLPWHMFGTSGHEARPDGLVMENYTARTPMPPEPERAKLLSYKTIVDPAEVAAAGTHRFVLKDGEIMFNDRGEKMDWADWRNPKYASAELLQLNHYFTKSRADFEMKHQRGRVSQSGAVLPKTALARMELIERSTEEDGRILRFAEPLKALMKERRAHFEEGA